MQEMSTMEKAVWAMDHDEAGKNGDGGKPPPTDDSTPNETLSNQAIRLRQLMSVLETQFSGGYYTCCYLFKRVSDVRKPTTDHNFFSRNLQVILYF